jgi:hypothetical protein
MRLAARIDDNHGEIADVLRQVGCSVQSLAACGHGIPDLLVGVGGFNLLFEIKDGSKAMSRRTLTGPQKTWHGAWHGKVHTVDSVSAALDLVAYYRGRLRRP